MRKSIGCAAFLALAALITGCGGGSGTEFETAPVSGTVYLDGRPVEGVSVKFFSAQGFMGSGTTDASGRYELVQGAVIGPNTVAFNKVVAGAEVMDDPEEGLDSGQMEAASANVAPAPGSRAQDVIPAKFSDPARSEVTFSVPEGGTDKADFRISSK